MEAKAAYDIAAKLFYAVRKFEKTSYRVGPGLVVHWITRKWPLPAAALLRKAANVAGDSELERFTDQADGKAWGIENAQTPCHIPYTL